MASSGMLRRVARVRTDVSEELTRASLRNIPEDAILHSHRRENLKSYISVTGLGLRLRVDLTHWAYYMELV
jgi:hypothetical protein